MLAVRMTTIDLSGSWRGHYTQNGRRHGISMQVVQRGQSFVGRMRDDDTLLASTEKLMAPASAGQPQQLLAEAEVLSTLPEHSIVEGEIDGTIVTFVKRYQGSSTTSVWVDGKADMTIEVPGHRVNYRGTASNAGTVLRGDWSIPAPSPERTELRDRFELTRQPS
jgi:hypothetical protein